MAGAVGVGDGAAEDGRVEDVRAVQADPVDVAVAGGVGAAGHLKGRPGLGQGHGEQAPAAEPGAAEAGDGVVGAEKKSVRLIEAGAAAEFAVRFELILGAAAEAIDVVGGAGVVGAEVDGFAEPVGGFEIQAAPAGDEGGGFEGVVEAAGHVADGADVGFGGVGAALVDGGDGGGDAGDGVGAVGVVMVEQLLAAAAGVTDLPAEGGERLEFPGEVVELGVGGDQVGRVGVRDSAGFAELGGVDVFERIGEVGLLDDDFGVEGLIEANLLEGSGKDFAVMEAVAGAEDAPAGGEAVGETEEGAEVVVIAFIGEAVESVDFDGAAVGAVAEAEVDGEVGAGAPGVVEVDPVVPVAEAAVDGADGLEHGDGGAEADVGDDVGGGGVVEREGGDVGVRIGAVELVAVELGAEGPVVAAGGAAELEGGFEGVLGAVDGDGAVGVDIGEGGGGVDGVGDGGGFGADDGADAVEAVGGGEDGGGGEGAVPGQTGFVGAGGGVGVLAADELEGEDVLGDPVVAEGELVAAAEALVEAGGGVAVVDGLGGVEVDHAGVDVGAVGGDVGVGVEDAGDDGAEAGFGGQGGAFAGEGGENVAVDDAAEGLEAAVPGEGGAAPELAGEGGREVVVAGGLDAADLEEGAGGGEAVEMAPVEIAVPGVFEGRGLEDAPGGGGAEFSAEVVAVGGEFVDEGGGDADALVELFLGVVVDEVELDVFVAAAFAGFVVGLAEEVQLGAGLGGRRIFERGGLVLGWFFGGLGVGSDRQGEPEE